MLRSATILALLFCLTAPALGQPAATPQLPQNPAQWVNFFPVSLEALRGKGVILYFYEEGCPNCSKKWPELIEVSKQYEGKPVVFMAVNSGNSRGNVMSYARQNNVVWPVIVDTDRSLEKQCNVPEVSLRNIFQMRIVKADGTIVRGNPGNLQQSAEIALQGASWKVDPSGIPADLKPSWMALELGEYAKASAGINKGLAAKDEVTKAAAQKMDAKVQSLLTEGLAQASQLASQNQKWAAYKKFERVALEFRGFDLPEEAKTTLDELKQDETVKNEIVAMKRLQAAKTTGARGTDSAVRRAVKQLEQIVETYPNTEGAMQAQQLLNQVNGQ